MKNIMINTTPGENGNTYRIKHYELKPYNWQFVEATADEPSHYLTPTNAKVWFKHPEGFRPDKKYSIPSTPSTGQQIYTGKRGGRYVRTKAGFRRYI